MQEMGIQSLGQEDPLEKEMTTLFCILAWEMPSIEVPGGVWSMMSQKSQTQLSNQTTINYSINIYWVPTMHER